LSSSEYSHHLDSLGQELSQTNLTGLINFRFNFEVEVLNNCAMMPQKLAQSTAIIQILKKQVAI